MTEDKSFTAMLDGMSEEEQEVFLDDLTNIKREEHVQYLDKLSDDDSLRLYADHYLATDAELSSRDNDDLFENWWTATEDEIALRHVDDEEEFKPPPLFATVPMGGKITKYINQEDIDVLTTVQVTFISGLGDVGINTNLEPTEKYQARVFYDSLYNYRSTVDAKFNP